jgi:hypothetical protein
LWGGAPDQPIEGIRLALNDGLPILVDEVVVRGKLIIKIARRHATTVARATAVKGLQAELTLVRAGANICTMYQKPPTSTVRPILPRHPRWSEFLERLAGPEACNFQTDRWTCFGDVRFTKRILRDMGLDEPSIELSTAYFRDHGGYCDCEVILNVDTTRRW